MARDAAMVTTWGQAVRGREAKALECFMDFITFVAKNAADGKCSEAEPFFAADGSGGFAIIRGKSDALGEIRDSDENVRLVQRTQLCVEDLRIQLYYAGDEVTNLTSVFAQVGTELGVM